MGLGAIAGTAGGLSARPAPPAEPLGVSPVPLLDDTAETFPDSVTALSDQVARRTQLIMLRDQSRQAEQQLRLDRMRADFNEAQELRSEQLREINALREMAVEQGKKDDEILKKFIAMI